MVRKIAPGEIVRMLVNTRTEEKPARRYLTRAGADVGRVEFIVHPTNRGWTRDSGPVLFKSAITLHRGHSFLAISTTLHPKRRMRGHDPMTSSSLDKARNIFTKNFDGFGSSSVTLGRMFVTL